MSFNKNWKFILKEDINGHLMNLDEKDFIDVDLPHDYSISQGYNHEKGEGCTGYLLGGIGWYRKKFATTKEMKEGKTFLYFDGIYNRANIYINEKFIAFNPYGYSPVLLDISNYLKEDENIIAVKTDHSRYADSRWYTGSGIYRNVELIVLNKTYIPLWGVKTETKRLDNNEALVNISSEIINENLENNITIETTVFSPSKKEVYKDSIDVSSNKNDLIVQNILIDEPDTWDIYNGKLYTAKIILKNKKEILQEKEVKFGIRTIRFDANKGFFLNDKNTLIKGVCLHHDAGLVGAAVPKDVWRRRLKLLIDCGCNAIRTAHNPASKEFLDLCDEMGLLVQEEFYDEWDNPKDKRFNMKESKVDYITRGHNEFFKDYAKKDLQLVINRDYNHPCVFQWSIGNEIEWTYPKYVMATGYFNAEASGNYFWEEPPYTKEEIKKNISKLPQDLYEIGDTAKKLSKWTKEIDKTRPVVANCILPSASYESGYTDALDIVGFSYRQVMYERLHKDYPNKPILGTENLAQWHEWKQVLDKPYLAGIFLWTGIDYIGESGNEDLWPRKAMPSGLLNLAGFKNPQYYMFKSLWSNEPSIYIATQTLSNSLYSLDDNKNLEEKGGSNWRKRLWYWQPVNEYWDYKEDEEIVIEIYSNCETIKLYLNNNLISEKQLIDFEDRIYKWHLPFKKGTIKAVGLKDKKEITTNLTTTTSPVNVILKTDRDVLFLNNNEIAHIEAYLIDKNGLEVKNADEEIEFIVEGKANIYGVDNGSPYFVGDHKSNIIKTNKGNALMIIGGVSKGDIKISAKLKNSISKTIGIKVLD